MFILYVYTSTSKKILHKNEYKDEILKIDKLEKWISVNKLTHIVIW